MKKTDELKLIKEMLVALKEAEYLFQSISGGTCLVSVLDSIKKAEEYLKKHE